MELGLIGGQELKSFFDQNKSLFSGQIFTSFQFSVQFKNKMFVNKFVTKSFFFSDHESLKALNFFFSFSFMRDLLFLCRDAATRTN